jgi:hypothetical protein
MGRGIRVSEKHGVNPSMGVCFWCGGDDGTVLLVGRLPNDAEAPRKMIASYEPCPTCHEQFAKGITIMECNERGVEGQAPITPKGEHPILYPTGRLVVVKDGVIEKLFDDRTVEHVNRKRMAYIDEEAFQTIFAPAIEAEGEIAVPRSVMEKPNGS